jgi:hypothetical protein
MPTNVGLGVIEPPLALFIAAVPLFKMLTNSALPFMVLVVGEILDGAAKPVPATPMALCRSRTSTWPGCG